MLYDCPLNFYLHLVLLYLCSAVACVIFIVLIYSLIKYRQSKGKQVIHFHAPHGLDILWTTIPFLILVLLALPAVLKLLHCYG